METDRELSLRRVHGTLISYQPSSRRVWACAERSVHALVKVNGIVPLARSAHCAKWLRNAAAHHLFCSLSITLRSGPAPGARPPPPTHGPQSDVVSLPHGPGFTPAILCPPVSNTVIPCFLSLAYDRVGKRWRKPKSHNHRCIYVRTNRLPSTSAQSARCHMYNKKTEALTHCISWRCACILLCDSAAKDAVVCEYPKPQFPTRDCHKRASQHLSQSHETVTSVLHNIFHSHALFVGCERSRRFARTILRWARPSAAA